MEQGRMIMTKEQLQAIKAAVDSFKKVVEEPLRLQSGGFCKDRLQKLNG